VLFVPNDRFITRTFIPGSFACSTTQLMPPITWETSLLPRASATFTLTIRAPGATPMKFALSVAPVTGFASASRPAMIPAMWVPWP
jgi:hypothetical protein